jgi:hypothetical protein
LCRDRDRNGVFESVIASRRHGGVAVTPRQQIKQEIRHLTRPIGIALVMVIMAIVAWGFAMRTLHSHLKEVQHVRASG